MPRTLPGPPATSGDETGLHLLIAAGELPPLGKVVSTEQL